MNSIWDSAFHRTDLETVSNPARLSLSTSLLTPGDQMIAEVTVLMSRVILKSRDHDLYCLLGGRGPTERVRTPGASCRWRTKPSRERKTVRGRLGSTLALLMLLSSPILAAAEESANQPDLKGLAESYFERLDAIYQAGSTEETIDRLLALMHENVRYEHPGYGANFDLDSWRAAFLRNLGNGSYGHRPGSGTTILETLAGRDLIVVKHRYTKASKDSLSSTVREPFVTLFEFEDGRIVRIRESW